MPLSQISITHQSAANRSLAKIRVILDYKVLWASKRTAYSDVLSIINAKYVVSTSDINVFIVQCKSSRQIWNTPTLCNIIHEQSYILINHPFTFRLHSIWTCNWYYCHDASHQFRINELLLCDHKFIIQIAHGHRN